MIDWSGALSVLQIFFRDVRSVHRVMNQHMVPGPVFWRAGFRDGRRPAGDGRRLIGTADRHRRLHRDIQKAGDESGRRRRTSPARY